MIIPVKKRIQIFDTTLRDGEQAPGASLTPEQKIILAGKLAELGVDVMEPGFPVSSPGDFAAVETISRKIQGVEICGFARAVKGDIDAAVRATRDAERRRIHLFISSSDIHLRHQLRKSRPEVVAAAREMTAYARQFSDVVEFTAMDAARTGIDDLIEMVEAVIEEGATIINLPDTVGYALPQEYGRCSGVCGSVRGAATRSSIAPIVITTWGWPWRTAWRRLPAVPHKLRSLSTEWASGPAIVRWRSWLWRWKHGVMLSVLRRASGEKLYDTSRMISGAMHFPIAFNKPVVGRNAFQHESGIHQDGLLKDRSTYEIMDPERLGIPRSMIILGKHSGRHALKDRAAKYGIALDSAELDALYESFKETADRQKAVSDDELLRMVSSTTGQQAQVYALGEVQVLAGSAPRRVAAVSVRHLQSGAETTHTSTGDGPLEAIIAAIGQGIAEDIRFDGLELHSLGSGGDAQAEAAVMVEWKDAKFRGTAIHHDIVMAAGIAYIAACNAALLSESAADSPETEAAVNG